MAYAAISKPSLYTDPKLYTGTGVSNSITGVGFQPDLTWIKARDLAENHRLFDAVRGVTKLIASNNGNLEGTDTNSLTAWTSDGFTVISSAETNTNTEAYVSWNWKANGAGSLNEVGDTNSTVSVNTTAGFSICKYVGTGSLTTVGHGLGVAPSMIFFKRLDASGSWYVYQKNLTATSFLKLDSNAASGSNTNFMNDVEPTSSVFTVNTYDEVNYSTGDYVAYCFSEIKGYSKFGKYAGSSGTSFLYTGFKPSFLMVKRTDSGPSGWVMLDDKRDVYNVCSRRLEANDDDAENSSYAWCDFLSNGIKIKFDSASIDTSGGTYVYMAFASEPLVANVGSGLPATAR